MDYNPLLLVFVIANQDVVNNESIVAYSLSFPGEAGTRCPEKLVTYMANKVYQQLHQDGAVDEDIDEEAENELD